MVYFFVFIIGALGYCGLEIIWRGYTHWTMALAGGISFLLIYIINLNFPHLNIFAKALIGALIISTVELVFGIVFNIVLKWNIWDYSSYFMQIKGQVCLLYSSLWYLLCFILFPFSGVISNAIKNLNL